MILAPSDERPRAFRHDTRLTFTCPGCADSHTVDVGPGGWTWNGDTCRVTLSPSVLVQGVADAASDPTPTRCHSFVTDGCIRFLDDCTHELAGKTYDLAPWSMTP